MNSNNLNTITIRRAAVERYLQAASIDENNHRRPLLRGIRAVVQRYWQAASIENHRQPLRGNQAVVQRYLQAGASSIDSTDDDDGNATTTSSLSSNDSMRIEATSANTSGLQSLIRFSDSTTQSGASLVERRNEAQVRRMLHQALNVMFRELGTPSNSFDSAISGSMAADGNEEQIQLEALQQRQREIRMNQNDDELFGNGIADYVPFMQGGGTDEEW